MKKSHLLIIIAGASLLISNCGNYIPEDDNHFVMMRRADIQIKSESDARQKYLDNPSHRLNIIKFLRELFTCKQSEQAAPVIDKNSTK